MATEINIGENIKKYRNKQGIIPRGFCQKIRREVKHTTLTKIESNVIKKPSVLIIYGKISQSIKRFN